MKWSQTVKNVTFKLNKEVMKKRIFLERQESSGCKLTYKNKNKVENKVLNISTNKAYTINDLFEIMAKIHGYKKAPIHRESRIGDIRESILDNTQLMQITKLYKFISLNKGLQRLGNYINA